MEHIDSKILYSYFKATDKILVGLSGGPDSVCLTYLLNDLRERFHLDLHLAHVNYKLRGEDSDLDEKLCRELADKLGLPIHVHRKDLSPYKTEAGNLQAEARRVRMEFFYKLLYELDLDKIALGHTEDDQVETVLGNLIRGCGLSGLGGIKKRDGTLVRPLLNISKSAILDYLDTNGFEYRLDRSNHGLDYTRNRLRNLLLPLLRNNFNPRVEVAVLRLAELAGKSDDYLMSKTQSTISRIVTSSFQGNFIVDLAELSDLHDIECYYLIAELYRRLCPGERDQSGFEMIKKAVDLTSAETGKRSDLGCGISIEKGDDCLVVFKSCGELPQREVDIPGVADLPEYNIRLHSELYSIAETPRNEHGRMGAILDFDKLRGSVYIRQNREGDRLRPLGLSGSKKLGDFFTDRKFPRALRKEVPLLVSDDRIAWVVGQEVSETFKLDSQSRQVVKLWVTNFVKKTE